MEICFEYLKFTAEKINVKEENVIIENILWIIKKYREIAKKLKKSLQIPFSILLKIDKMEKALRTKCTHLD